MVSNKNWKRNWTASTRQKRIYYKAYVLQKLYFWYWSTFERSFNICDLFYLQIIGICNILKNKVVSCHPCIVLFWVGRYNKTLNDWPHGKQWVLFPLDPQCSPRLRFSGKQNSLFPLEPVIKCLVSSIEPRYMAHWKSMLECHIWLNKRLIDWLVDNFSGHSNEAQRLSIFSLLHQHVPLEQWKGQLVCSTCALIDHIFARCVRCLWREWEFSLQQSMHKQSSGLECIHVGPLW